MKKKIYKALSIVLAVMVAFSVCTCIFGVTSAATEITYYVSEGATGGDGSESKPFATVDEAVVAANTAGSLVSGDTLVVKVLNNAQWGGTAANTTTVLATEHAYNLVVKSGDEANPVTVKGTLTNMTFGGPTTLENITLNAQSSLHLMHANFVLKDNAAITVNWFITGRTSSGRTIAKQKIEINGSLKAAKGIILGNDWNGVTYTDGIEFLVDDAANTYNFNLGSANGMATYANITIDVKAANGVTFSSLKDGSNLRYDFTNGFLQVLNASPTVLDIDDGGLADIDDSKKIIVNNTLGAKDLVTFTATKGKFATGLGFENVKAVSTDGSSTVDAVNNELTLTAGKAYNVTADKIPETKTYFVKANATAGDGTEASPFANVGEAVSAAIDAGLVAGDVLNVKLLGTENIDWGSVVAHRFKLNIESDDVLNKSTVVIPTGSDLMGETEIDNLIFNSTTYHSVVRFGFNKVVIGEGVTSDIRNVVFGNVTNSAEKDGMTAQLNYAFTGSNILLGNEWSATNYTGDVNVGVNNAAANIKFSLTTSNGKNTYQNVNINVENAASIQFVESGGSFEVQGVFQLLNSSPNPISATDGALDKIDDAKKYIVNNVSGDSGLLEFTDTVGKYKVNSEYDVYAVKAGTTERILPTGEYLVLGAGEYTVDVERDVIIEEYYVSSNGTAVTSTQNTGNLGSKENPVLTIADATKLISNRNLRKTDIAKIIVQGSDVVYWGEGAANCAPILQIQSATEGVQATVTNKRSYGLVGNTVFKDIILEITDDYQIIRINNFDVTFDTGSSFTSATYICLGTVTGSTVDRDVNVVFKGTFNPRSFNLTSEWGSSTYNGDINIVIDSDETAFVPIFGGNNDTNTVYNGNINITLLDAKTMNLKKSSNANANVTFNGSLQVLADSKVELPYAVKTNFNEFEVSGGKWYVTNYSDTIDLVQFSNTAGEFNIKDNKKVYVRDVATEVEAVNATGRVTLASGEYMISDKHTPEVVDESHKMLRFSSAGNGKNYVYVRFPATPGKTYVYELSYYTVLTDNTYPTVCEDGNRPVLTDITIISDEIVDNYHKVVCEFTVPETYTASDYIFAGLQVGKSNDGVLFDQLVYEKGDASKTNVMLNNNFHNGLDEWALSMSFWGNHWTGERGGAGVLKFQSGVELLEVMNFDLDYIKELIASANPQDGEWWDDDDIHEEIVYTAYTSAKGTFKDENGNPISDRKFALVSADGKTYNATSNAKGEFNFGKIVVNFYDLYLIDDEGNMVHTGYSGYLEEGSAYTFDVVSNMSGLESVTTRQETVYKTEYITTEVTVEKEQSDGQDSMSNSGDNEGEQALVGDFSGTVYTPMYETVPNLKLIIDGVGEVVTDENGSFAFAGVPVGTYELYTVLSNGEKYVLKEITIVENNELVVKLKYDPPTDDVDASGNGWIIWVIIASVIALAAVGVLVLILLIKKKKAV